MTRVAGISNGFLKGTSVTGGGTSGTGKNYLAAITTSNGTNTGNGDFEDGSTTGWSLGNVSSLTNGFPSLGSSPTFGSGASANLSIGVVSSGQLAGSYSGSYASSAASVAGDFLASDAFYIDTSDKHSPMTFSFSYLVESGTVNLSGTSSNSFGVAIWDVTNSAWIQPAGSFGMDGSGYCTGTFQTSANSTQYRLVIYNANATSGAFNLYVDSFTVGPQTTSIGPAMSDWQSYDLVIGATTTAPTLGTTTVNAAFWRRVGDSMQIKYDLVETTAGAAGSGTYLFPLPPGYSIDSTKLGETSGTTVVGSAQVNDSANTMAAAVQIYNSTTLMMSGIYGFTNTGRAQIGSVFQLNDANLPLRYSFLATIPIVGWSSNTVQSSDTDTRVVAARATVGSYSATSGQPINISSVTFDTHGAITTGSSWKFTAPVTGYYKVSAIASQTSTGNSFYIYKNGSVYSGLFAFSIAGGDASGSDIVSLNSNDYIDFRTDGNINLNSVSVSILRLSGPAVVQATESVNARYTNSSGQSIPSNSFTQVTGWTKDYDSHNAFSNNQYVIPLSGKYQISGSLLFSGSGVSSGGCHPQYVIYKNGTQISASEGTAYVNAGEDFGVSYADSLNFQAGDIITIYVFQANGASRNLNTNSFYSRFSIERVVN